MAPGRGGLQPELAIAYGSERGNGLLGIGWSLEGLSSITRCAKTVAVDGVASAPRFDASDALCLDGQRLIPALDRSGETPPVIEYKTEIESFSRIRAFYHREGGTLAGPDQFEVVQKGGRTLLYGTTSDSRIDGLIPSVPQTWAVSTVEDRAGNTIRVSYAEFQAMDGVRTREYYPTAIRYGHHTSEQSASAPSAVAFHYIDRPDALSGWRNGIQMQVTRLLSGIDIIGENGAFRHYALSYEQESSHGRSTLVRLTECADVPAHDRTAWPACKRPIELTYNSNANQPEPFSISSVPSPFRSDRWPMDHNPVADLPRNPLSRHALDLNGDGRTDLMTPQIVGINDSVGKDMGCTGEVHNLGTNGGCIAQQTLVLSRPDQSYEVLEIPIPLLQLVPNSQNTPALSRWDRVGRGQGVPVDLDNDGDDELFETDFAYQGQSQNNYSVVDFVDGQAVRRELVGVPYGISNPYLENFDLLSTFDNSPFAGAYVLDSDGDGLKDVITCSATSLTAGFSFWTLYRNLGTGVIETTLDPGAELIDLGPCKARNTAGLQHTVVDVDGDGREELILRHDVTVPGAQRIARFNLDDTVSLSTTDLSRLEGEVSAIPERMIDINGDGLIDFMQNDARGIRFEVSRGDGTFQKYFTATPNLGWAQPADNQVAIFSASAVNDLNGDGLQDLVVLGPQGWRWLRSTGTSLVPEAFGVSLPVPPDAMHSASPVQGDFDGNGSDDVALVTFQGIWPVIKTNGPVVPELSSVTSPLGSTTTISYLPLKDARVYEPGSCVFPQHCEKRTARRVVESVSQWDAPLAEEIQAKQMRYSYQDARRDLPGRKWLGFATVAYQELVRGEADVSFRQMSASLSSYDNATYDSLFKVYPFAHMLHSTQRAVNIGPSLVRLTHTSLELATTSSVALHPYVRSSLQGLREGPTEQTTHLVHAVARDFGVPDAFGNPKTTTETWFEGPNATVPETRTRTVTYAHESDPSRVDAWQVDLVREVRETSSVPALVATGDLAGTKTRITWFFHFPNGLLERKVRAPFGPSDLMQNEVLERDLYGNVLKNTINDGLGFVRSSSVIYDSVGLAPVTFINAKSQQTRVFVDSRFGRVTRTIDPNDLVADTWFDDFGRVRMAIGPDNVATTYGYDRATVQTPLRHTIDAEGGESVVFDFDVLARPVRTVRTGLGGLMFQVRQYDNRGFLVRVERPHKGNVLSPQQTLFEYDDLGRLRTAVHPNGGLTAHCYADRKYCVQNARGFTSCSERDAVGGIVRSVDPVDAPELCESALTGAATRPATTYTYGAFGDLRFVDDVSGNRRAIETDEYGRKTDVDDPDAGISRFFYNGFDELLEQHDANGNVRFVLPDALGRPIEQRDSTLSEPDVVRTTRWFWDGEGVDLPGELIGTLSAFESADGNRGTLEYDTTTGRVVASEQTRDEVALRRAFAYDALGRLQDITHPAPLGRGPPIIRYAYDTSGHLIALQDLSAQIAPSGFFWKLDELAPTDDYGQLRIEHLGNTVRTERTYHPDGAAKSILSTRGGVPIQDLHYDVDLVDNVTTRYDMQRLQWESFGYDKLDRLRCTKTGFGVPRKFNENCVLPGGESADFGQTLDALGRIASTGAFRTYAYGGSVLHAPSEIEVRSQGTVTTFEYDANGNRIREDNGMSARGFSYTPFNKIREAWREGATPDEHLDVVGLEYDAFENRIAKTSSGRTTIYFGSSYERRTTSGSVDNVYLIEGPSGPVAQLRMPDGAGAPELRYLRADHLGSIHIVTDEAGNVVDERSHAAFGRERNPVDWSDATPPTSARQVERGFTGHEADAELGLTNMLGRHYDPETSLFLQPDPYVQAPFFSQSLNRFAYVFNNPLKFVDPSGFQGEEKGGSTGGGGAAETISRRSGGAGLAPNQARLKSGGVVDGVPGGEVLKITDTSYSAVSLGDRWGAFESSGSPEVDRLIGAAVAPWGSAGTRGTSQTPGLSPGSATADSPGQSSGAPAGGPGGPGASGATSGASTGTSSGASGSGSAGDGRRGKIPEDASSKAWQDALIAAAFFGGEPPSSILSNGGGSEFGAPGGRCEDCEGNRWWQAGYLLGTVAKVGPLGAGVGRLTRGGGAAGAGAGQTFEIVDGLRRAKAAELAGKTTVAAEVRVGGRVVGTMDIPLDSLRSPFKSAIDVSSHPSQMSRFKSILDATRAGDSLPPISVQPGGRGSSISDIVFK
jgi:RHS repeat-associated protein